MTDTTHGARGPAIRVRHLWHHFGTVPVLRDVSFDVAKGEIFGFIGPNGAGKTTMIRVLATLLEPSHGLAEIDGVDVTVDPDTVRRTIGYMPDHAGVYERITVREYLEFFGSAYGVPPSAVGTAIDLTDLGALAETLVQSLSKGMRQRLQLARVLLHEPELLVLDEPASDLDPRARVEIRDLLIRLRERGKTIFLSSHILSELSDVCSSVGIIEKGRLLAAGPIGALSEQLEAKRTASVRSSSSTDAREASTTETGGREAARDPKTPITSAADAGVTKRRVKIRTLGDAGTVARLIPVGGAVVGVEAGAGGWLSVHYVGGERCVAELVRRLVMAGAPIVAVESERNELERIFLEVTGAARS